MNLILFLVEKISVNVVFVRDQTPHLQKQQLESFSKWLLLQKALPTHTMDIKILLYEE